MIFHKAYVKICPGMSSSSGSGSSSEAAETRLSEDLYYVSATACHMYYVHTGPGPTEITSRTHQAPEKLSSAGQGKLYQNFISFPKACIGSEPILTCAVRLSSRALSLRN